VPCSALRICELSSRGPDDTHVADEAHRRSVITKTITFLITELNEIRLGINLAARTCIQGCGSSLVPCVDHPHQRNQSFHLSTSGGAYVYMYVRTYIQG
jgi:hypothetical protein